MERGSASVSFHLPLSAGGDIFSALLLSFGKTWIYRRRRARNKLGNRNKKGGVVCRRMKA